MTDVVKQAEAALRALDRIGDGDWTPQDVACGKAICALLARLVELDRENEEFCRWHVHELELRERAEAELERENERLRDVAVTAPCECYDVPTLAPTDNPQSIECERCAALDGTEKP